MLYMVSREMTHEIHENSDPAKNFMEDYQKGEWG